MQHILNQLNSHDRGALIELFRHGPLNAGRTLWANELTGLINRGLATKIVCNGVTGFVACTEFGAQIYHELMEC